MMLILSDKECISRINKGECFHAEVEGGAFRVKIDEYAPIICTAIHSGTKLRTELLSTFLLSKEEQRYEEAPFTDDLISSFPIQLIANDSRFEYDLNRAKTLSTSYKPASGNKVWEKAFTKKQRLKSHAKHQSFYDVLEAIIRYVEKQFKNAIVFDIRTYNYQQIESNSPTFNVGTGQIDVERWQRVVTQFEKQLKNITLPNIDVSTATNEVFQGQGYLITHINAHFDNTLVLPVDVKKVFMDESSNDTYPLVLEELKAGFKNAISETAAFFVRRYGKKNKTQMANLLPSKISPEVLELDRKLYALCKTVETLNFLTPVNLSTERKKFLKINSYVSPNFIYKQLDINPYKLREKLYKLPVDNVKDAGIQQLYRHVIDNLASKIDLLASIGTENFRYNSLKYYGEPSPTDLANARFLLHLNTTLDDKGFKILNADEAVEYFRKQAKAWGLKCRIEKSSKMVAKAMVNNEKALLLINKSAEFNENEIKAIAYHELGVHMLTTLNAKEHPLKIFSLGLPGNTHTQEGVAIYSEYCSGSLTNKRLQTIALRVVAVKYMLEHCNFVKTYHALLNEFELTKEFAFSLTTRVYRGGGFTKDYVYLKGFRDIINLAKNAPIDNLLVGKTGLIDFDITNELVERGMISKPIPLFDLTYKPSNNTVLNFVIDSIK